MQHPTQIELQQLLSNRLADDRIRNYGRVSTRWIAYAEGSHGSWENDQQRSRIDDLKRYGFFPGTSKILDLAAGCGQFVQAASEVGYDIHGIEPAHWKRSFLKEKFRYFALPSSLADKVVDGVGEALPFPDNAFDCVTTYQTLEHVANPERVIQEMVRVARVGGGIYIRCPDYRSTFEAHYQLPWIPLLPKRLARVYLRILNRPTAGLASIRYVTQPRIKNALTRIEADGIELLMIDDSRVRFENILRRKHLPLLPGLYEAKQTVQWIRSIFRKEMSVNLFVRVLKK